MCLLVSDVSLPSFLQMSLAADAGGGDVVLLHRRRLRPMHLTMEAGGADAGGGDVVLPPRKRLRGKQPRPAKYPDAASFALLLTPAGLWSWNGALRRLLGRALRGVWGDCPW